MSEAGGVLQRVLLELVAEGSLRASALGRRAESALQPLFDMGALIRVRSGAGWRIAVQNEAALHQYIAARYPAGLEVELQQLSRAEAVFRRRNAKHGENRVGEPVLIRAFSSASLRMETGSLNVAEWTRQAGVAAFLLQDDIPWDWPVERVATVENLEPFLQFEHRFPDFDAVIYTAGRMSVRLLNFLAGASFSIVHFGDYDPVGLQEYLRLSACCPGRATLYVPEDLEALVVKYGRPELLRDSVGVLARLRQATDPAVRRVLTCLEGTGFGLEQEVLWR